MNTRYCHNRFGPVFCDTIENMIVVNNDSFKGANRFENFDNNTRLKSNNQSSVLHDIYDEHIKPNLPLDDKAVHPVFHHFKTRPTANSVHPEIREKAIITKAALLYYRTGSKAQVENFLHDMNVGHKYTIDFKMSNSDGLVSKVRKLR